MTDTATIPTAPHTRRSRIRAGLAALARSASRWRRRVGTLAPHSLLFGAVFQKEMRVTGRKNATFLIRGIYALLLVGLATLVFFASRAGSEVQAGAAAIQRLQDVAPAVTAAVLWFQMILLPMVTAVLAGPSICDESRNRSLPALLTTPLTAPQIIVSKLTGILLQVGILALVSVPMLLGLRLFGGVDPEVVLAGSAITLTSAVLAGSIGMLLSVYSQRSALAGSAAIAGYFGLVFVPIPLIFLLMARFGLGQGLALQLVGGVSSPVALGMVLAVASGDPGPPGLDITSIWIANAAYNLVVSAALLVAATLAFRARLTGDRAEATIGAMDRPRRLWRRRGRGSPAAAASDALTVDGATEPTAPLAQPDPLPAPLTISEAAVSREVGDRPVLWRELRRRGAAARSRRKGLTGAVFAIAMLVVLGVFLPCYGMIDATQTPGTSWSTGVRVRTTTLGVATGLFTAFVGGVVILIVIRSLKRVVSGAAVVLPPRGLLTCIQVFGVLLFAYWMSEGEFEVVHMMVGTIGPGLILLRAASQNAGMLAEEREARTWETLLTTRLSPREILFGKLAGALARQWDLPVLVMIHLVFAGVLLDGLSPVVVVHMGAVMIAGIVFLSGTGMLFSLLSSKGSTASLLNTGLALTLWLILPIGVGLAVMALEVGPELGDTLGAIVLGGQPLALGVFALRGAIDSRHYSGPDAYSIVDIDLSPIGFSAALFSVCILYLLAGYSAYRLACGMFNRRTGRTS